MSHFQQSQRLFPSSSPRRAAASRASIIKDTRFISTYSLLFSYPNAEFDQTPTKMQKIF